MIYLFLSIVAIVIGALYGLHVVVQHLQKDHINTELSTLLARMDLWDAEAAKIRTTAAEVNTNIANLKQVMALNKQR